MYVSVCVCARVDVNRCICVEKVFYLIAIHALKPIRRIAHRLSIQLRPAVPDLGNHRRQQRAYLWSALV